MDSDQPLNFVSADTGLLFQEDDDEDLEPFSVFPLHEESLSGSPDM